MNKFYDALETRSTQEREAALMAALPGQVAHAQCHAPALGQILAGVDAASITTRAALALLATLEATSDEDLLAGRIAR